MHKYLEELSLIAISKGGRLLSTEYINSHTKYKFIDEEGNEFEAIGYSVKQGRWSPYTAQKRKAISLTKYTIDDLKAFAETKGGKCLSTEYIKDRTKYLWEDSSGRQFTMTWASVLNDKYWSPHEKAEKLAKLRTKYSIEQLKEFAISKGGQCLSDTYTKLTDNYEWIDRNGVRFTRTWAGVQRVDDLLYNVGGSKPEQDLADFIQSLGITCIRNDRKLINPLELDMYIPELNLAIEFNGARWHCEENGKDRNYHLNKLNLCKSKGVDLIQILDTEWKSRSEQVKSFLTSKLGKNDRIIYARKTTIKEVSYPEAKQFLNDYHILGSCRFTKAFGLYNGDELLSLITIGLHHRNNKEYVLSRFVGKRGVSVAGGLSRLVKYASSEFGDLTTWIDLKWSNGQSWIDSGWELLHTLKPDYSYYDFNDKKSVSKQSRKKSAVNTPEGMTELEHATKDGLSRIWDCGKLKLIYRKSNT